MNQEIVSAANNDKGTRLNHDVQKVMNIHHFEELMDIFQNEKEEESGGFPIDQFREVFGRVFKGILNYDDITTLFMKIDANSDGTVTWDEFSTYMMMGTINSDEKISVISEDPRLFVLPNETPKPHKDMIKMISYSKKEKKFVSVSQEGGIAIWEQNLEFFKSINARDFAPGKYWVTSAVLMKSQGKIILSCDDSRLYIFDLFSLKPRLVTVIGSLDNVPTCVDFVPQYDDRHDLILWGDEAGFVHTLFLSKKFFIDNVTEDKVVVLDSIVLGSKTNQTRLGIAYRKKKMHGEWICNIKFSHELNSFVSVSSDPKRSLAIGDMERKIERFLKLSKGITCFEISKHPNFLITAGVDKVIRLWNPYVLNKPAGNLSGHSAPITHLTLNDENGFLYSLDQSKTLYIWSTRSLQMIQKIQDVHHHRPENVITSLTFDHENKILIWGHEYLEAFEPFKKTKLQLTKSHDNPVISAMYNQSFRQVVSSCSNSVKVWNLATGEKLFQFSDLHEGLDITCAAFDKTRRRLLTGSQGGEIRMWNFNNGQMLQKMITSSRMDITRVFYLEKTFEKFIICTGWDRKISLFEDDPGNYEVEPFREYNHESNGHIDDILTIDFCYQRNIIASASADGQIILWNFDSGHIRTKLSDPDLMNIAIRERSIEKILFLQPQTCKLHNSKNMYYLLSFHSDGFLRVWNWEKNILVKKVDCRVKVSDGISSAYLNRDAKILLVGTSSGHVKIFHIENEEFVETKSWRAHLHTCLSIEYIDDHSLVLTSSKDETARLWTDSGEFVGLFGVEEPWDINDPRAFHSLPSDISNAAVQDFNNSIAEKSKKRDLKLDVIRQLEMTKLGINPDLISLMELELRHQYKMQHVPLNMLRERVICRAVANKWTNFTKAKKEMIGALSAQLDQSHNYALFTYQPNTDRRRKNTMATVKHEFAFHNLKLTEISPVDIRDTLPLIESLKKFEKSIEGKPGNMVAPNVAQNRMNTKLGRSMKSLTEMSSISVKKSKMIQDV